MRRIFLLFLSLCLLLILSGCREKANAVIIVSSGGVTFHIQPEVFDKLTKNANADEFLSILNRPGTIFVYRTDTVVKGETKRAGRAYRNNNKGELEDIGEVDLNQTDEEISRQFGIKNPKGMNMPK